MRTVLRQAGHVFSRPVHPTIPVEELRVGMHIHLDGGWLSHPFPLSSFRLTDAAQIAQIRALGLAQVRWSPELGIVEPAAAPGGGEPPPVEADAGPVDAGTAVAGPGVAEAAVADPAATNAGNEPDAADGLARQQALLARCERQFGEALQASDEVFARVHAEPQAAGRQAEALARALVDKLIDAGDVCVRLLSASAGAQASAHAVNVGVLALLLGRSLGLGADALADIGVGALLHDVGKLELPHAAREAADSADDTTRSAYRSHVALGVAQARRMALSSGAVLVIAQHHERHDGAGFPMGAAGARMTPAARIVALVNRYDKLCNPAWSSLATTPHEAVARLFAQDKAAFEPELLAAFIKLVGVYPPGSLVQLSDDRHALVVGIDRQRPLRPRVVVHAPGRALAETPVIDLAQAPGLSIRRSLRADALPPAVRAVLVPQHRLNYFWEPVEPAATGRG